MIIATVIRYWDTNTIMRRYRGFWHTGRIQKSPVEGDERRPLSLPIFLPFFVPLPLFLPSPFLVPLRSPSAFARAYLFPFPFPSLSFTYSSLLRLGEPDRQTPFGAFWGLKVSASHFASVKSSQVECHQVDDIRVILATSLVAFLHRDSHV